MMKRQEKQTGFTLIELLVAMTIGILMLTAAMGLFISNKRIYKEQDEMGRLQENARFAIDLITQDIRMAAYSGCLDDNTALTNVTTNAGTATNLHNFTNAVEGIDGKTTTSTWSPSGSTEDRANMINGTDAITIRYLEPIPDSVIFTTGSNMGSATAAIPTTCFTEAGATENCSASHITANENIVISDCASGDIFRATGSTNTTITHSATLSKAYDDSAQISRYVTTRYYIGTAANANFTGDAIPALYRYTSVAGVPTQQELIEGIERMEILYGVDTNADGVPNSYLAAGATGLTTTAHWNTVVSVKISILVRTINENFNIDDDLRTYTLLNATAYDPADEHLRRRQFTTTVQIRNRAS
eukprot:gnl/TRDRNA2_/TRDRNA2_133363_c0_seq1.p1 gnl/TRDRNA2_/TRDRNA2_133363_c0~~gnl/TRDRNA2_/TRDRNA2_133363_c0_seq1.p1  ORF type:complete len:359 (-),score=-19.59 gnl/TRDRNA2_/TRDRNA2_133363_c0_seq1:96-1172(-)